MNLEAIKRLLLPPSTTESAGAMWSHGVTLTGGEFEAIFSLARGMLVGSYSVSTTQQPAMRSLLTAGQGETWADVLRDLHVLLHEAAALQLGAVAYCNGETLFCEVGPADRTLLLAIDAEGTTVSFRELPHDFGSYVSRSWDSLPPLHDFRQYLADYLRPGSAWTSSNVNPMQAWHWQGTRSSGAGSGTIQTSPPVSITSEAFASSSARF